MRACVLMVESTERWLVCAHWGATVGGVVQQGGGGAVCEWNTFASLHHSPRVLIPECSTNGGYMSKKRDSIDRLAVELDTHGMHGLLDEFCEWVSIGENPVQFALQRGMMWMVMRKWLEDSEERMKAWELAERCFADGLQYDALKSVKDASIEGTPLAKLRSDVYKSLSSKLNRAKWSDKAEGGGGGMSGGVTVIIGSIGVPLLKDVSSENAQVMVQPLTVESRQ